LSENLPATTVVKVTFSGACATEFMVGENGTTVVKVTFSGACATGFMVGENGSASKDRRQSATFSAVVGGTIRGDTLREKQMPERHAIDRTHPGHELCHPLLNGLKACY
jgi:hypothetical protein